MTTHETAPTLAPTLADSDQHRLRFVRDTYSGKALIQLDGVDIAEHLSGIQIVSDYQGTHVALELHPRAVQKGVEFDGIATVVVNSEIDDPGPAAAKFLAAMDPETLEKAALSRLDLENEPHGGTAAMLRQLIEWAEGKS